MGNTTHPIGVDSTAVYFGLIHAIANKQRGTNRGERPVSQSLPSQRRMACLSVSALTEENGLSLSLCPHRREWPVSQSLPSQKRMACLSVSALTEENGLSLSLCPHRGERPVSQSLPSQRSATPLRVHLEGGSKIGNETHATETPEE